MTKRIYILEEEYPETGLDAFLADEDNKVLNIARNENQEVVIAPEKVGVKVASYNNEEIFAGKYSTDLIQPNIYVKLATIVEESAMNMQIRKLDPIRIIDSKEISNQEYNKLIEHMNEVSRKTNTLYENLIKGYADRRKYIDTQIAELEKQKQETFSKEQEQLKKLRQSGLNRVSDALKTYFSEE